MFGSDVEACASIKMEGIYKGVDCGVVEEENGADTVKEGVTGKDGEYFNGEAGVGDDVSANEVPSLGGCVEGSGWRWWWG